MKAETGAGQRAVGNTVNRATGNAFGTGQRSEQVCKIHTFAAPFSKKPTPNPRADFLHKAAGCGDMIPL